MYVITEAGLAFAWLPGAELRGVCGESLEGSRWRWCGSGNVRDRGLDFCAACGTVAWGAFSSLLGLS